MKYLVQHMHSIMFAKMAELSNSETLEKILGECGAMSANVTNGEHGHALVRQYSSEVASYLLWLKDQKISSYLEVGTLHGGMFAMTVEYLKMFHPIREAAAMDMTIAPLLRDYCETTCGCRAIEANSHDRKVEWPKADLVFVDASHLYEDVRLDYLRARESSTKLIAFHDVANSNGSCPGVMRLWKEIEHEKVHLSVNRGKDACGIGVIRNKL